MELTDLFEMSYDSFACLPREEFDALARGGQFIEGPVVANPPKWMTEFGPYNPHRWAFGRLQDGRLVKCDVAAAAKGGEK